MSSIHFILTRPSGSAVLIQLSFNHRNDSSPADSHQYLMQAVSTAIQNVTRSPFTASYRRPAMSPASAAASQSLFRSLSTVIQPPPSSSSPANPSSADDPAGGSGHLSSLNDFLRHSIEDHVSSLLEQTQQRLSSIDEEMKADADRPPSDQLRDSSASASAHLSPSASAHLSPSASPAPTPSTPHLAPLTTSQSSSPLMEDDDRVDSPPPLVDFSSDSSLPTRSSLSPSSAPPLRGPPAPLRSLSEPSMSEASQSSSGVLSGFQSPIAPEDVVHRGVTCDGCSMHPLRGIRYKCGTCADYDLCHNCHRVNAANGAHQPSHPFITFLQPRPDPLVRALEDFLRLILQSGFVSVRMIGGMSDVFFGGADDGGSRPAAKSVVAGLERVHVDASSAGLVCVVCQEELVKEEEVTLFPSACHHVFHVGCLTPWLEKHSQCPMCRAKVKDVDEEEEEQRSGGVERKEGDNAQLDR